MTPSVTTYPSIGDFLTSALGQSLRGAQPASLVPAQEGQQQVRATASMEAALAPHPVQGFADMAALMASPYGALFKGLQPEDVATVRLQDTPRPSLGQALGLPVETTHAGALRPHRPHRPR